MLTKRLLNGRRNGNPTHSSVQLTAQLLKPLGSDENDHQDYLGWRRPALAEPPTAPKMSSRRSSILAGDSNLKTEVKDMMESVLKLLAKDIFLKDLLPLPPFMHPNADCSMFAPFLLERVKAINSLGGPRMRVVWCGTLAKLGRLPKWPQDAEHILDVESLLIEWIKGKVDGRLVSISLFSHRWERPSLDPTKSHPDTVDNMKASSLAKYGERGICPIFYPHHIFDYFCWIDYAGIDQEGDRRNKWLGVAKLPAYVAACSEMILFHTAEYKSRAWTRLECCMSYVYSLALMVVFLNKDYVDATDEPLSIDTLVKDHTEFSKHEKTGGMRLEIKDPLAEDAGITDPDDKELIRNLLSVLRKSTPLCPGLKAAMAAETETDSALSRELV